MRKYREAEKRRAAMWLAGGILAGYLLAGGGLLSGLIAAIFTVGSGFGIGYASGRHDGVLAGREEPKQITTTAREISYLPEDIRPKPTRSRR